MTRFTFCTPATRDRRKYTPGATRTPASSCPSHVTVYWPGACTYTDNGLSMLAGSIACGTLTVSAAAGSGTSIGSDYGINTALVEAVLIE